MKHALSSIVLTIAAALVIAGAARGADVPTPPLKGFDAFRFIKSRNVFDPERRGMPSSQPRASAPPRANFINLTGTMVAEGKMLAFFSGSRSEYSKVIGVGDAIADFKITAITNTHVELDHSGKTIKVAVGKPVPLEGSSAAIAPPVPTENGSTPPASDASAPDAPAPDTSAPAESKPAAAPGGDDKSEILRRMMERRAKEMSK